MKTYTFTDNSWTYSVCDCCPPTEMECYTSDNTDCNLGSAHSYESCYVQAIITSLGGQSVVSDEMLEELWCMDIKGLKSMTRDLNIKVKIIS